jgi:DNA polymerase III psi subunit
MAKNQMPEKHLKKCSISLIIRGMQIKTTLRFYLTPARISKMKNSGDSRCWQGCGEEEHSSIAGGIASWYNHSGNQSASSENWT